MKKIVIILLILIFHKQHVFSQGIKYEFQINKIHCLFNFVDAISGSNMASKSLSDVFKKSQFNNDQYQNLIDTFLSINLLKGFDFENFPSSRKQSRNIYEMLVITSAKSKDLNDFSNRIFGLLSVQEHNKLINILKAFEPVYNELIWNKNYKILSEVKLDFEKRAIKANLSQMINQVNKFYANDWDPSVIFKICLYPIIGKNVNVKATPIGNIETVGIPIDQNDFDLVFGSIVHELCHSFYDSQSAQLQNNIEHWFTSSTSKYAVSSYLTLNEGLATAIGQGWAIFKLNSKMDSTSWHTQKYFNNFGKALFPLISEYLDNSKSLDSLFVERSIEIYAQTFPDALIEYDNIFANVNFLINDRSNGRKVKKVFRKYFFVNQVNVFSTIDESSIEEIKSSLLAKVIICFSSQIKIIEPVIKSINILTEYKEDLLATTPNYVFSVLDEKGRAYIIIKIDKIEDLAKVTEILATQKLIDLNHKMKLMN